MDNFIPLVDSLKTEIQSVVNESNLQAYDHSFPMGAK
jgi:hypothetical protein